MWYILNIFRIIPLYLVIFISKRKTIICEEAAYWNKVYRYKEQGLKLVAKLLVFIPEYRNITQKRLREVKGGRVLAFICKIFFWPLNSLYINTNNIGKNCFLQHGFSTIISAKSIGDNCWINQQVTIGYEQDKNPIIGNNVRICAGAIVIGDVRIGDNAVVGAGAVVTKDVPENEVWGGVPAHYIKNNIPTESAKERVNE